MKNQIFILRLLLLFITSLFCFNATCQQHTATPHIAKFHGREYVNDIDLEATAFISASRAYPLCNSGTYNLYFYFDDKLFLNSINLINDKTNHEKVQALYYRYKHYPIKFNEGINLASYSGLVTFYQYYENGDVKGSKYTLLFQLTK